MMMSLQLLPIKSAELSAMAAEATLMTISWKIVVALLSDCWRKCR